MTHSEYTTQAILDGYVWECPCGELCNSLLAASYCRKCRIYTPEFAGEWVSNIATGEVFGTVPTHEEMDRRLAEAAERELAERATQLAAAKLELEEKIYWEDFFQWEDKAESLGF